MKISVVIPLYNGEKYINYMLNTMKCNSQKLPDGYHLEILFIKDSTESIEFDKYKIENLDVKFLENKENKGIHYSRVRGILCSSGEYIHMLDQDDKITEDFYLHFLKYFNKGDVIVGNGIEEKNGYDKYLYKYYFMQSTVKYKYFYTKFSCRIISPGQCLIKKTSIPNAWIQNIVKKNGSDDAMLWLMMLHDKRNFIVNRYVGYRHINTGANLSLDIQKMNTSLSEIIEIMKKTNYISKKDLLRLQSQLSNNNKSFFVKCMEKLNKK